MRVRSAFEVGADVPPRRRWSAAASLTSTGPFPEHERGPDARDRAPWLAGATVDERGRFRIEGVESGEPLVVEARLADGTVRRWPAPPPDSSGELGLFALEPFAELRLERSDELADELAERAWADVEIALLRDGAVLPVDTRPAAGSFAEALSVAVRSLEPGSYRLTLRVFAESDGGIGMREVSRRELATVELAAGERRSVVLENPGD